MGKVWSMIVREAKMYNIEERAYKVISKEKPSPAPLPDKTVLEIEQMMRENPSGISEQQKKNEKLDKHLKNVFVLSTDPLVNHKVTKDEKRSLPQLRQAQTPPEYGYVEQEESSIPVGKFTLLQVLQMLSDHQSQPDVYTADYLAKQYKIKVKVAENILQYYSMFGLYIPKDQEKNKNKILQLAENLGQNFKASDSKKSNTELPEESFKTKFVKES